MSCEPVKLKAIRANLCHHRGGSQLVELKASDSSDWPGVIESRNTLLIPRGNEIGYNIPKDES